MNGRRNPERGTSRAPFIGLILLFFEIGASSCRRLQGSRLGHSPRVIPIANAGAIKSVGQESPWWQERGRHRPRGSSEAKRGTRTRASALLPDTFNRTPPTP